MVKKFETLDKVSHLKTGTIMTIKKNYGNISSCYLPKENHFEVFTNRFCDIAVCHNYNLTLLDQSPTQGVLW